MRALPLTLKAARLYVAKFHRHHKRTTGGMFAIGAEKGGELVGVVIVGRPVAPALDDGATAEIIQCCTDGTRNACSFLYRCAERAARAMGYGRVITYTHTDEGGASLRGAGFAPLYRTRAEQWSRAARPRAAVPLQQKIRWEAL
jgi:hypothetical protein